MTRCMLGALLVALATASEYEICPSINATEVCDGEMHKEKPCHALTEFEMGYIYESYGPSKKQHSH